jgi:ferrous iron transport protein A
MNNTIPLKGTKPGQHVRVTDIAGGQDLRARLCAMGLTPGMAVEVVSTAGGPIVLRVMGSRLMIGHGMAAKIMVRTL